MAEGTFTHAAWTALASAEDHFARLGGQNRFPGFEPAHPALFIVGLLAANTSAPAHGLSWTPEGLHHALGRLRFDAPQLWDAMQALQPWNPARFPATLLDVARRHLAGVSPTSADIRDFETYLDGRLPNTGSRDRDALREVLRELAAGRGEGDAPTS